MKNNINKNTDVFKNNALILLGVFIASVGINGFIKEAKLLSGGISGLAMILNYLFNVNIGIFTFILNIPVFIIGFIFLDKKFCFSSFINMLLFSISLSLTNNIGHFIHLNDIFLQSIYGGILCGVGYGLIFKAHSSLGGTDIIAAILKLKKNVDIKDTSLSFNICIMLLSCIFFDISIALYTLISMYINANVTNKVKDMLNYQKSLFIISSSVDEISIEIMNCMHRGVTFIHAEGAYTHEQKKIIYCIIDSSEIPKIKDIVGKYDKKAFISINNVAEVKGRGFKEKTL